MRWGHGCTVPLKMNNKDRLFRMPMCPDMCKEASGNGLANFSRSQKCKVLWQHFVEELLDALGMSDKHKESVGEEELLAEDVDGGPEGQSEDTDGGLEGQVKDMEGGTEGQAEDNMVEEDMAEDPLGVNARLSNLASQATKRLAEEGEMWDCMTTNKEFYEQVETEEMGDVKRKLGLWLCPLGSARRAGSSHWPACSCLSVLWPCSERGA